MYIDSEGMMHEDDFDDYFHQFHDLGEPMDMFSLDTLNLMPEFMENYANLLGLIIEDDVPDIQVQDGILISQEETQDIIANVYGCPPDMVEEILAIQLREKS